MFWGYILKEGKSLNVKQVLEQSEYPVLHISNVSLSAQNNKPSKVYLQATTGKDLQNLVLAVLQKDKHEMFSLDLYVNL